MIPEFAQREGRPFAEGEIHWMRRDERGILPKALAQARIVTWFYDPADASLRTSPNAGEIFGLVSGFSLRNPDHALQLLHPDDRLEHLARVEEAHQQGSTYVSRFRVVRPDNGETLHLEEHGFAYRGVLSGIILDVTERTRLELRQHFLVQLDDATRPLSDALEITQAYARLLGEYLEVNRCAYCDVEEDQNTFNLTGDWNRGVESIVGRYTFRQFGEEVLRLCRAGQPYVVEDCESDARVAEVLDAYRATEVRAVICVGLLKGGRLVAAMAVNQILPRCWRQDEVELVTQVANRCWESIERARLLRAERRANQAKEYFLATLSHEMRTPLNAVLGWAQILAGGGLTAAENQAGLETIQRNVTSLTQLIEDLLDTTRIESGKIRLELSRFELGPLLAATLEALRPQAIARGVSLSAAVGEPAFVWVDGHRMQQILVNLVGNALKFTPAGGQVRVSYEVFEKSVEIAVSDSGIGIGPELLPNVFDRFRQSESTSTRRFGGLGLGLAIVKDLAELHGGWVRAFSLGLNQGATFTLIMPLCEVVGEAPGEACPGPSDLSGVTILAVDDDRDGREMLHMLLERSGARVLSADSVAQALDILQDEKPDLLVSDLSMPEQDGFELIARVRRRWTSRQLPALALTALARAGDRTLAAGFQKHLSKPVNPAQLMQALNGLLQA